MSKLKDLIQEYCPDGVEYKELSEIVKAINIGVNPRKFFKLNPVNPAGYYVTVRELDGLNGVKQHEKTDLISREAIDLINNRANIEVGDVLYSNTGTVGKTALVTTFENNWSVNEGIYVIKPKPEIVLPKFLYYYLNTEHAKNQCFVRLTGSTLKHITQKALAGIEIPVPSLPVQEEIVHILDKFTKLEAELEAELEARRKQYEFYRNTLLDFTNTPPRETNVIQWRTLKEIAKIETGKLNSNASVANGKYMFFTTAKEPSRIDTFRWDTEALLIAGNCNIGEVKHYIGKFEAYQRTYVLTNFSKEVLPRYLYFVLENSLKDYLEAHKREGTLSYIVLSSLEGFNIPIPPIEEQRRIVSILDRFDKICNSLTEGLPAEIEMQKKRHEFYRDKLLTFERKEAN